MTGSHFGVMLVAEQSGNSLTGTAQGLVADDIVHLYELDATVIGGGVYRFTSSAFEEAQVSFGGHPYAPTPIETDGWEMSSQGTMPRPTLKVANVNGALSAVINEFGDLVGCTFRRIRTFRRFLDGMEDADPDAFFPIDTYRIEQKTNQNRVFIEWTLAAAMDQQGRQLPGRQVLQSACTHSYRRFNSETGQFDYAGVTCPYTGSACFDRAGNAVSVSEDKCSKLLQSGCVKRFGTSGLPTRAFPGVGRAS
ncbi:phage minor tail protein L [Martelella alba]|uniref:Phage minor tail protein L n=1 Tax=Martelella alba TaxID=2590451 RepID=A0A506U9B3_9HYPH|nr:phage minor tail protein L [Martelella alba]TPW29671.1 phage minor tail protein L [Martelella alba]